MREHHVEGGRLRVDLAAYGYLWLRARRATVGPHRPPSDQAQFSKASPLPLRDERQLHRSVDPGLAPELGDVRRGRCHASYALNASA